MENKTENKEEVTDNSSISGLGKWIERRTIY